MDHPERDEREALRDAVHLYFLRRSLSTRLAAATARHALASEELSLETVLRSARAELDRYLPPGHMPRLRNTPDVEAALAALMPRERELLLLHHWDGLDRPAAGRLAGMDPERFDDVEASFGAAFATRTPAASDPGAPSRQNLPEQRSRIAVEALRAADPARHVPYEEVRASRGVDRADDAGRRYGAAVVPADSTEHVPSTQQAEPTARIRPKLAPTVPPAQPGQPGQRTEPALPVPPAEPVALVEPDPLDHVPPAVGTGDAGQGARRSSRLRAVVGGACLVAITVALAVALVPPPAPEPGEETARLFEQADVVAVVDTLDTESMLVDDEVRILQTVSVMQFLKGGADTADDIVTIDVTGRSTSGRPYSRNLFPPYQLVFLDRRDDGGLTPLDGDGAILTLVDLRTPGATTTAGAQAALPDDVRDAIDALPDEQLRVETNDSPPGALDPDEIVGIRPAEGRDEQNLPGNLLGSFRLSRDGDGVCSWFEFNERSVLLRWPNGFSAYDREQAMFYADGDPQADRRILTILNERGYPYVDENRTSPFIRGIPTGEYGTCAGQELEMWDIAITPGNTLLNY